MNSSEKCIRPLLQNSGGVRVFQPNPYVGYQGSHPLLSRFGALSSLVSVSNITARSGQKTNERRGTIEVPLGQNKNIPEDPEAVPPVWDLLIVSNQGTGKFDEQKPVFKVERPKFCS